MCHQVPWTLRKSATAGALTVLAAVFLAGCAGPSRSTPAPGRSASSAPALAAGGASQSAASSQPTSGQTRANRPAASPAPPLQPLAPTPPHRLAAGQFPIPGLNLNHLSGWQGTIGTVTYTLALGTEHGAGMVAEAWVEDNPPLAQGFTPPVALGPTGVPTLDTVDAAGMATIQIGHQTIDFDLVTKKVVVPPSDSGSSPTSASAAPDVVSPLVYVVDNTVATPRWWTAPWWPTAGDQATFARIAAALRQATPLPPLGQRPAPGLDLYPPTAIAAVSWSINVRGSTAPVTIQPDIERCASGAHSASGCQPLSSDVLVNGRPESVPGLMGLLHSLATTTVRPMVFTLNASQLQVSGAGWIGPTVRLSLSWNGGSTFPVRLGTVHVAPGGAFAWAGSLPAKRPADWRADLVVMGQGVRAIDERVF